MNNYKTYTPPARHGRGFTLVELMVVVAILGILAALAAPALGTWVARYQSSTAADELSTLIATSQVEAIKRGGNVVLQKATTGANPCATNQDWSCGVVLWADINRDGVRDATDQTIRVLNVPASLTLLNMSGASPDRLTFNRWGRANGINALNFRITRGTDAIADRSVCVTSGGRTRIVDGIVCQP